MQDKYSVGIDIGSTTAKIVITKNEKPVYERYERHMSQVRAKLIELLCDAEDILKDKVFTVTISGSAGMGLAESAGVPFIQEVFATAEVVKKLEPDTSCVIELGGEDAKVIFFEGGRDERMNGSCAGGTGAFIDQMAVLLGMSTDETDALSLEAKRIYPIASRCGVFAKTDIQPLLNQGASKADVAASIFQAVVNQTITGLAQGRKIKGKVLFLGGPLYYCKGLRLRFKETLNLDDEHAVFPEYGRHAVALGAALSCGEAFLYEELLNKLKNCEDIKTSTRLSPLFSDEDEYLAFKKRHAENTVCERDISEYSGGAWLGIDCGSTTTKLTLISEDKEILYSYYSPNLGNPVTIVKEQLEKIYSLCGDRIKICGSASTGYGEELIKNAFSLDTGIVETIAHYTAAAHFMPNVDFILDIGGQDIKCFKIKNKAIDSIMLNEACSSGCGSFIETFARSMGYTVSDFAEKGIHSKAPANLGTRCTVFMNSSVKQSQKEGASVEDISAGLSVSVVKNALYKVIRANSPEELGKNIVVQGGTFLNDAILRAFELEVGTNVIRPSVAGLMGAYGAALYAMKYSQSSIISPEGLSKFVHESKAASCKGCGNNCRLTVNIFDGNRRFISGNQCEKGLGNGETLEYVPNLYKFKQDFLSSLKPVKGKRGTVGIPLALGTLELAPLWYSLFSELGFEVKLSRLSTRKTYEKGQLTIPSDTACYPAKIMHGHIAELLEEKTDFIFYPCLSYNIDEGMSDNFYNCPIVAYYSELLRANMDELKKVRFLSPFLNVNKPSVLARGLEKALAENGVSIKHSEMIRAVKAGLNAYYTYMKELRLEGERAVKYARENGKRIMILAGRPYHADPEINHGIDKLALSLGFVVVSEDSVCMLSELPKVNVLNQWTYHSRLYRAAKFASENNDVELVQLVSFGCGIDAITTDEVRALLEEKGKLYTQIKIDEITNLGAVRIRLRSLLGAIEDRE